MQGIVQRRIPAPQSLDALIDLFNAQMIDHHIGSNIIADNNHQRGDIPHPHDRPCLQGIEHPASVHKMLLLIGQHLVQIHSPLFHLIKQAGQYVSLDRAGRLNLLIRPHGDHISMKIIGINTHGPVITLKFRLNPFLKRKSCVHPLYPPFLWGCSPISNDGKRRMHKHSQIPPHIL